MKHKKIIISVICLMMAGLSLLTFFNKSSAQELNEGEIPSGNFVYRPINKTADGKTEYSVRGAHSAAAVELEIPSEFNGGIVSAIEANGFKNYAELKKIIIPDSIRHIGNYAFSIIQGADDQGCAKLSEIYYNAIECEQSMNPFEGCGADEDVIIYIGKAVKSVPAQMFGYLKNLSRVVFAPDSQCESIGFNAFYCDEKNRFCRVENFPETVYDLGYSAFNYDTDEFLDSKGIKLLRTQNSVMYLSDIALDFDEHENFNGEIEIRDGTLGIADYAFSGNWGNDFNASILKVTIPGSVKAIGEQAFANCRNLSDAEIDTASLIKIENDVFSDTPWLNTLFDTPPNGTRKEIGYFVYYNDICFGYAKSDTRFVSYDYNIKVKEGIRFISSSYLYDGRRLVSSKTVTLELPDSLEYISSYSLCMSDSLTRVNVPKKISKIERAVFYYNPLLTVTVEGPVSKICAEAFLDVKSVNFLTAPAAGLLCESTAFNGVRAIIVPANCAADYRAALFSMDRKISYSSKITTLDNVSEDGFVIDDDGLLLAYIGDKKEIVLPNVITAVCNNVFENSDITKITINPQVRYIGNSAFLRAEALKEVIFEEGSQCVSIGNDAFFSCFSLTSVTLPQGLKEFGLAAFMSCSSLKDIRLPDTVEFIGWRAFDCGPGDDNCALYVTVPAALTEIDAESYVFYGAKAVIFEGKTVFNSVRDEDGFINLCDNVKCVLVPDEYYDFYRGEFSPRANIYKQSDLDALDGFIIEERGIGDEKYGIITGYIKNDTAVVIPKINPVTGVPITTVGVKAFFNNTLLTEVIIPESITLIEKGAFEGCTGLKRLEIHSSDIAVNQNSFEGMGALSGGVTIYTKALPVPHPTTTYTWIKNETTVWFFPKSANIKLLQIETGGSAIDLRLFFMSYNPAASINSNFCFPYVIQIMDENAGYYFKHESNSSYRFKAVFVPDGIYESLKNSLLNNWPQYKSILFSHSMLNISGGFMGVADGGELLLYLGADKEVALPLSVTNASPLAFDGMGITDFTIENSHQYLSAADGVLFNKAKDTLLVYPQAKTDTVYTLPSSVIKVEERAFYGNNYLRDLKADFIGVEFKKDALSGCSLEELYNGIKYYGGMVIGYDEGSLAANAVIRAGTVGILSYAFDGCSKLTELTLPEGLIFISQRAFNGCANFSVVHLPKSLARIGAYAFAATKFYSNSSTNAVVAGSGQEPRWLVGVKEDGTNNITIALNHALINGSTGTSGITGIADKAFLPLGSSKTVNLTGAFSQTLLDNSLRIIGKDAFCGTGIWNESSNNDGGIVYFCGWALGVKDKNLLSAVALKPDTVGIAAGCFEDCTNLSSVNLGGGVKYIGFDAFKNSGIYNSATEGVVYVGGAAVGYKGTGGKIAVNASIIAAGAFFGANVRVIEVGANTEYIGAGAFYVPESALVLLPSSDKIKYFPYFTVKQNVFVPDNYLSAYKSRFSGVDFVAKSLLKDDAFYLSADKLTLIKYYGADGTIFIPYGVKTVSDGAFSGCRIEELCLPYYSAAGIVALIGDLGTTPDKIYVADSLSEKYKAEAGWATYRDIISPAPSGYTAAYLEGISDGEYYNNTLTAKILYAASAFLNGNEIFDGHVFNEGAYQITLNPYFGGGSAVIKFTVDMTAPILSGNLAAIDNDAKPAKSFSGQISDANFKEAAVYSKSDGYTQVITTLTGTDIILDMLDDGAYKIVLLDLAGNQSEYYIIIDNTPPVLSGGLATAESQATAAKSFSGLASDTHYTQTVIYKKTDGYTAAVKTFSGTDIDLDGSFADGIYKIVVRDGAGNAAVYYIFIDNTPPLINGVYEAGVFLAPVITFEDGGSGIKSAVLNGKSIASGTALGSFYSNGNYTLTVTDNAGNVCEINFILNNTPVLSYGKDGGYIVLGAETWLNVDTLYLKVSNCEGAELTRDGFTQTLTNLSLTIDNIAEGSYIFKLIGNAGVAAEFIIHIVKSAPVIIMSVKDINGKTVNKNVTVKSVNLGIDGVVTVKFNGEVIDYSPGMKFRENGDYVISVIDKTGQEAIIEFRIDKRIPASYTASCVIVALIIPCAILFIGKKRRYGK